MQDVKIFEKYCELSIKVDQNSKHGLDCRLIGKGLDIAVMLAVLARADTKFLAVLESAIDLYHEKEGLIDGYKINVIYPS